jgi:hypothetical protein
MMSPPVMNFFDAATLARNFSFATLEVKGIEGTSDGTVTG